MDRRFPFLLLILGGGGGGGDDEQQMKREGNTPSIVPRVSLTCCRGIRLGFMIYTSCFCGIPTVKANNHISPESFQDCCYIFLHTTYIYILLPAIVSVLFLLAENMYHFEQQKKKKPARELAIVRDYCSRARTT